MAAGVCDGLGLGDNTKAALMTRGIREISRLGVAMGAKLETFGGLSGIGDLIVTCCSMHSRNRRAGILIGKGVTPEEAVRQVGTVEAMYAPKTHGSFQREWALKCLSQNSLQRCFLRVSLRLTLSKILWADRTEMKLSQLS